MQYFKNTNDKTYIQWNVESGSGFLTVVTQVDAPTPPSSSLSPDGGKVISINFFSGSVNSFPPVGSQIYNWETRNIKNPDLVTIDKEEYDTYLSLACTNVQTDWVI
jgi:hypothetical protein